MQDLAWQEHGSGPPLLLVNGYAATGADWDPILLGKLARDFTLICPDNRGMGGSAPAVAGSLTSPSMAADLAALLDALELERVARRRLVDGRLRRPGAGRAHPERVVALGPARHRPRRPEGASRPEPEVAARLFDHVGHPARAGEPADRAALPAAPSPSEIDARVRRGRRRGPGGALPSRRWSRRRGRWRAWYEEPAEPRLAAIDGSDPGHGRRGGHRHPGRPTPPLLAAAIEGAELETFPGAGHAFIAQEAPRVAAAIGDFLG